MKMILLLFSCLAGLINLAQSQGIIRETWEEKPVLHKVDKKLNEESAIIILDKRRVEYIDEKEEVVVYKTLHRIVHINDDKGIESFNRVYLPVSNNSDIVDIKARTILSNGKIIEVSKNNIKDLKEEDDRVYKIFAMEGLEKNCEVEFYYTYKKDMGFFGNEILQGKSPVLEAKLELVGPNRLIFEMKSFNTATKPRDTILNEKRWITVAEKDIPGAEDEKYCALDANLKRFEFKLAYNTSRKTNDRLLTWDELAKRIYQNYTNYSDKEIKKVNDLVSDMKVKNLANETEKIVAVENYIKTNFATREDIGGDDAENLEKVIKSKLASYLGIVRLYGAIFQQLNIQYEFVLTADRTKYSIDKNFENWNNCDNPVLYFPAVKKFMAPTLSEFRLPWIDPNWGNANAFFCKSTTIGNFTTAFGEVKMIPLEDYTKSVINTEADIQLNESADTLIVNISQIYSGYAASTYKAIFTFSPDETKKLVTKEMIKFGTNSENLVSSKMENADFESYHDNKPFILSATVKASELVEKAGNKTIIKIGDIIGPQVEMYQEKPRQFPMNLDFPHILERKINFTIPDGYIVKNLDDLKISHTYQENGQTTMGFNSSYQVAGNIVKITVLEEYRRTYYPLSQFEDFKTVINAAADFNKVALVLEKK
ncbi:MAG TPA: DUF3857 domain-containing protein [Chitinophagaceae bacterium]|nr:DUF3857 domain-containing protein [Chitinophagaceae bacterium]